jgi:hypothetical protein
MFRSTGIKYWSPKALSGPNANKVKGKILSDAIIHDLYKKQGEFKVSLEIPYKSDITQVVCIEYTNLTGLQEREIFHRIQMGLSLGFIHGWRAQPFSRNAFILRGKDGCDL